MKGGRRAGLWLGVTGALALVTPAARAETPQVQQLDGSFWQFRMDPADPALRQHPEVAVWQPASVPGSVQQDLLRRKLIPDPFAGRNEALVQWVGLADWDYRLTLDASPALLSHAHVDLVFDGLDTFADVALNGRHLLSGDNQFRSWRRPVKDLLRPGSNTIDVLLHSPIRRLQPWLSRQPYVLPGEFDSAFGDEPVGRQTASYVRKAAYGYGWDWGPRIVTEGIWKPARLEAYGAIRLEDFNVVQTHLDDRVATLDAQYRIRADKEGPVALEVTATPPSGGAPLVERRTVMLEPGENEVDVPLRIAGPQRWYPVDYGAPALYGVHGTIRQDGEVQGEEKRSIGLRDVVLRRDPDQWGRGMTFVVNGIPVFAKGANLIPFDSLPGRVTTEDMRKILVDAHDAHMNMLRVWGGGTYLDDSFYALADRLGIMIWQDFMFGGAVTPADRSYRENVREEAIEQVRRLRDHPSIVLWCGNNEIETGWESWADRQTFKQSISGDTREQLSAGMTILFGDVLRHVVEDEGNGVPYWATTPGTDFDGPANVPDDGDMHVWDVWSGGAKPVEAYLSTTPRFLSEFGLQSMPDRRTLAAVIDAQDRAVDSPVLRAHQKYDGGNGNERILLYVRREYGEPRDFDSFIYLSQLMQADGIALEASHLRMSRPRNMGVLYWQLNDVWPGASWSSIDHDGRRKMLQFRAAKFYAPLAAFLVHTDGRTSMSVVSDQTADRHVLWRLRVVDMAGRTLFAEQKPLLVKALSATPLGDVADAELLHGADPRHAVVVAELLNGDQVLSRAVGYFKPARELALPDPGLSAVVRPDGAGATIQLTARRFARAVWLDTGTQEPDLPDNGFDLLPGETRTLHLAGNVDAARLGHELSVRSLYGQAENLP